MDRRILLLKLDEHDATPMYMQLARKLTAAIETGQWQSGEALPSERTLTEALGISRVTARRALKVLSDEGTISKNRGTGTFIAPRFQRLVRRLRQSRRRRQRDFVARIQSPQMRYMTVVRLRFLVGFQPFHDPSVRTGPRRRQAGAF